MCTGSSKYLVTTRSDSETEGLWIRCTGQYNLFVAPDEYYYYFGSAPAVNSWVHVVVVWDKVASQLLVYYDGVLKFTESPSTTSTKTVNMDNRVAFGPQFTTTTAVASQGRIDAFSIYNRPLSSAEVAAL